MVANERKGKIMSCYVVRVILKLLMFYETSFCIAHCLCAKAHWNSYVNI